MSCAVDYDGPDESVECAFPGCRNRLRRSWAGGPQFCSGEHRDAAQEALAEHVRNIARSVVDTSTEEGRLLLRAADVISTSPAPTVDRIQVGKPKYLLLWHPDSPGGKIPVRRRWWRRRRHTATLGDVGRYYDALFLVQAGRGGRDVESRCT